MNNQKPTGFLPAPELLAPAGSPACALAAFDAGADAIYAGLVKFNARERGENFSPELMAQLIDYAHKLGRKVYVTLNTLVKESELPEIAEYLALLSEIAPDAILVQDLGVIRMAREYFPELVLHASTQLGFHNSSDLKIAQELGFTRVVLERQMTIDEIADVARSTNLELEVFIHGALCASLSGQCLFSSYLGGYSGNRGKCKQPCRRRYFSKNGNGFFFSTQDLCGIEQLPRLRKIGITSLKIEGRLRQPDYIKQTVSAYRMLLDASPKEFNNCISEARCMLSKGCGRKWSQGFFSQESAENLIQHNAMGASGLLCGKVESVREGGFDLVATKRLALGDRIRIQPKSGDDGPAITITRIFKNDQPVRRIMPGDHVFIGCDKPIAKDGLIFKIGENFGDYSARIIALPLSRTRLNLKVILSSKQISITTVNAALKTFNQPLALARANNCPATSEALAKEFASTNSETFALGEFEAIIEESCFLPVTELKKIRRKFWEYVGNNLRPEAVFQKSAIGLERFRRFYQALKPGYTLPEKLAETVAMKPGGAEPANRRAIRATGIYNFNKLTKEAILPNFCPEGKLESLSKAIRSASASGIRRFRATSLGNLALLRDLDTEAITASTPLPVCNSMAVLELSDLGVTRVMVHLELERDSIEALCKKSILPLELYRYGRPVLLNTRAKLPIEGVIHDARGTTFSVRYNRFDGMSRIYPLKIHSVPRLPGVYDFYDLTNANWQSKETGTFNFNADWF